MRCRNALAVALCLLAVTAGCGKSSRQLEQERITREESVRQAIEASLAEERAKDRQMREAAAAEANERLASIAASAEEERERLAAQSAPEKARAEALAKYTERLRQSIGDTTSLQVRNAELAPKQNGLCAEFSAKDNAGALTAFKRVVVTDTAVNPEEPPDRETLPYFLAFQVAARDTGCFPDVLNVHVLR